MSLVVAVEQDDGGGGRRWSVRSDEIYIHFQLASDFHLLTYLFLLAHHCLEKHCIECYRGPALETLEPRFVDHKLLRDFHD